MSMFDFFQRQRQLWLNQPTEQSPEYVAGGVAALDQAETAFLVEPQHSPTQADHQLQRKLDTALLKLQRQNTELQKQRSATHRLQKKVTELTREQEKRPKWGSRARRHLRQLNALANDPQQSAEARLEALTHLIGDFFAQALTEQAAQQATQNPPPAD